MNEASATSSSFFSFSAAALSFVDDLFDDLEELDVELDFELLLDDLPDLSCFYFSQPIIYLVLEGENFLVNIFEP